MAVQAPSYPLTPDQFRLALARGQGRARTHVREHGVEGVEELILLASLEDWAYDAQLVSCGPWLASLLLESGLQDQFMDRQIASAKAEVTEEFWTLHQQCWILHDLAQAGFDRARPALYRMNMQVSGGNPAEDAIVSLDGIDGVLHLVRSYGRLMKEDPESGPWSDLIRRYDTDQEGDPARDAVTQAAESDPDINRWWQAHLERESEQETSRANAPRMSVDQLISQASRLADRKHHFWCRRWGKMATEVELLKLENKLFKHEDARVQAILCRAFEEREWVQPRSRWIELLHSESAELRYAAARVIGQTSDPAIQLLAIEELEYGVPRIALDLLQRNLEGVDADWLLQSLPDLSSADVESHLTTRLITAAENAVGPASIAACQLAFEQSLCAFCRGRAVEHLIKMDACPRWMLEEARYDVEEDCRDAARAALASA